MRPKTVCLPSSQGHASAVTMKNCEPFVSGPAFAIARRRRATGWSLNSSSNVARPTGAVAERAATLDHEVGDHTVERESVVVALGREPREVLDGLGGVLGEELELDRPFARLQDRAGHPRDATNNRRRSSVRTTQGGVRCGTTERLQEASSRPSSRASGRPRGRRDTPACWRRRRSGPSSSRTALVRADDPGEHGGDVHPLRVGHPGAVPVRHVRVDGEHGGGPSEQVRAPVLGQAAAWVRGQPDELVRMLELARDEAASARTGVRADRSDRPLPLRSTDTP